MAFQFQGWNVNVHNPDFTALYSRTNPEDQASKFPSFWERATMYSLLRAKPSPCDTFQLKVYTKGHLRHTYLTRLH